MKISSNTILTISVFVTMIFLSTVAYAISPGTWTSSDEFTRYVSVTGTVSELEDGVSKPLPGVTVELVAGTDATETTTNSQGMFTIQIDKTTTPDLAFIKDGYFTKFKRSIDPQNIGTINIILEKGLCSEGCSIGNKCDSRCYGSDECNVAYAQSCHNRQPGWRTTLDDGTNVICCSETGSAESTTLPEEINTCAKDIISRRIPAIYQGNPVTIIVTTFNLGDNC